MRCNAVLCLMSKELQSTLTTRSGKPRNQYSLLGKFAGVFNIFDVRSNGTGIPTAGRTAQTRRESIFLFFSGCFSAFSPVSRAESTPYLSREYGVGGAYLFLFF